MSLTAPNTSALEQATEIKQKQQIIKEYICTVQQLADRIALGEQQFGVPYTEAHQAIDDGRIEETVEVCSWLIDIDRFERLERA